MDKREFARRRKRLTETMDEGAIVIISAPPVKLRNRDAEFMYRPDSDFFYLTGFPEPDAVAVFVPGREQGEYLLFCRERDVEAERWHGSRVGLEGACDTYGADDAFPISDIDDILPGLLENRDRIFYSMGNYSSFDQRVLGWVNQVRSRARSGVHAPAEFFTLEHLLHDLRLFKSKGEIAAMEKAVAASEQGHRQAMAVCRPGMNEYELEAELVHQFMRAGCRSCAYTPIVAGGGNACTLHYTANDQSLQNGQLVLIDAGAEYDCYAADITRTFPVNGRFSPAQRAIYELVLAAQEAAIEKIRPGNHWNEPHEAAVEVLAAGLKTLGILKGSLATILKKEKYKKFYMHRTGHWIGMDVHDVGDYKLGDEWRVFEPGMCLTVEPGLYIEGGDRRIARKWWNIGVRIEDDFVVTEKGIRMLTQDLPRTVDEVEAMVGQG